MLIYKYYYGTQGSDIFNYYTDGKAIYNISKNNFSDCFKIIFGLNNYSANIEPYLKTATNYWFKPFNYSLLNDNRLIIRINAILHIISNNNIYVHSIFFSFFSFIGLTAIYKFLINFSSNKIVIIIISFFIPSVMIWSSAMLKESVLILALGIFLLSFINVLKNKKSLKNIIGILLSIYLLILLKFYVFFALIPGILFFIINKFYPKKPIIIFAVIYLVSLLLFFNSQHFTNYNLAEIISFKQHDFINMLNKTSNVGSRINIPIIEPNFMSFISAVPSALLNTFLRPSISDIHSIIVIPAVAENLIFLILFFLSIKNFNKELFFKNIVIILFSISFIITLSILIGLTTPVLGAIVRYKIPYIIFLAFILTLNIKFNNKKLKN